MNAGPQVLLLAGSSEASELARRLPRLGIDDATISFAGRTRVRVQLPGIERVGGFGGVDGLVAYLRFQRVDVLIDATHPFAAHMPHHAAEACGRTGIPRLRVQRPAWAPEAGDRWEVVADLDAAADALIRLGVKRVFLTTGRQELAPFARVSGARFLVRAIETPEQVPFPDATVILDRGPFRETDELALMRRHRIEVLVSKNSGGSASVAKLRAARALDIPVVMIARPPTPPGPVAATVDEAVAWLQRQSADG